MLAVVCLSMTAFGQPTSMATVAWMARAYELVLVCPHHAVAPGCVSELRKSLSGRVAIVVLVDGVAHRRERELIHGIIHDGNVPIIVTTGDPVTAGATDWLDADLVLSLPDGAPVLTRADALR
jgi:hypothetical protein